MAQDYERTAEYVFDLEQHAERNPEILNLPKRCGRLPVEYNEILTHANILTDIPQKYMRIETAMTQLGFIGGYQVFKRWELVAQKKPKPRKPVLYDFSIKDFEKKYKAF